jgi:peptidoglycan/xylan/chitin deacetylase (PgdA/CDA1 family)
MEVLDARGHEIGLHATYGAVDNVEEMRSQRTQLKRASGVPVESVRQHCLYYDIETTSRVQSQAGLRYDSSLAVTGNIGFRFGTSWPWQLYDLDNEEQLPILEMPLIVQDTALMDEKYLNLTETQAVQYVRLMADRVADVGGVLTLNWHPNTTKRGDRFGVYERVLRELDDAGAWFGTVYEIGEWWRDNMAENSL